MIAVFVTWKQLGFFILLYLAALQNVPKELYEAADVDGASTMSEIPVRHRSGRPAGDGTGRHLATITGMNLFTEPYLLTNGGGPDGARSRRSSTCTRRASSRVRPDTPRPSA